MVVMAVRMRVAGRAMMVSAIRTAFVMVGVSVRVTVVRMVVGMIVRVVVMMMTAIMIMIVAMIVVMVMVMMVIVVMMAMRAVRSIGVCMRHVSVPRIRARLAGAAFDRDVLAATSANRTHHATSSSLTRISSPPVT